MGCEVHLSFAMSSIGGAKRDRRSNRFGIRIDLTPRRPRDDDFLGCRRIIRGPTRSSTEIHMPRHLAICTLSQDMAGFLVLRPCF